MASVSQCNWSEKDVRHIAWPDRMNREIFLKDLSVPGFRQQRFIPHHKEITAMLVQLKTALAVLLVASMPLRLGAEPQGSSSEALSAREVRKAEREARTADDHSRLAAWYQFEARQTQNNLTAEEDLVKYWSQQPGMVNRTKIPNPYWSAQALARFYSEKLQNATKHAASHQKLAESLEASAKSNH
jgi:hypothetical protein